MAKKEAPADSLGSLKRELKEGRLGRLYVFHGEETFLLHHYLDAMKKQLLDPVTESFNYHRFNSENFDLQRFSDAVENLPMMAEHTFIQADDIDLFKLGEEDRGKMAQVLEDIPEYCTVVFVYITVPWKLDSRYKKLAQALKAGAITEFPKQGQRELVAWVARHFAARGKKISSDLCAYLIDLTGGTMTALSAEIGKICAYSGADTICKADIDAVTEPVLEVEAFQMTDLLGAGRYDQALVKLRQLFQKQQEPLLILGAVGSHLRRIAAARTLLDAGKTAADLRGIYSNMYDYAARRTMESARRFSPRFCQAAAALVLETDYRIKTSYDDGQRLLELLLLRLAQEARHD